MIFITIRIPYSLTHVFSTPHTSILDKCMARVQHRRGSFNFRLSEDLFSSRSNIEVVGAPSIQETSKGRVIVVPARINANLKAKTMEEVQAQRKALHMSLIQVTRLTALSPQHSTTKHQRATSNRRWWPRTNFEASFPSPKPKYLDSRMSSVRSRGM